VKKLLLKSIAAAAILVGSVAAHADILKIGVGAFTPQAGLITFGEKALGTENPVYAAADYGGGAGAPTVSFGGYFTGQAIGTEATCPAGAAVEGCVTGSPTGPLSLAGAAPKTFITDDSANPNAPVLSGSPIFNGPIAILFSQDLAGVGLEGGYFDAIGGTAITAFARDGTMLGQVKNEALGIEFLGLVTDDGSESIAGLLFSLVGDEPAGFAIDNLRIAKAGEVTPPGGGGGGGGDVPEPASLALVGLALAGVQLARRRKA
jgi:hypothetical protein